MGCWTADPAASSEGFATPAAAVVSLALAIVASATTALAVSQLSAAQAEAAKTRAEYRLDGLQQMASLAVATDTGGGRLQWSTPGQGGAAEVLAEAEGAKLGLGTTDALDAALLKKLGVVDGEGLRRRLSSMSLDQALGPDLDHADAAPLWRACARSLFSPYGTAKAPPTQAVRSPVAGGGLAHGGEVWRIRVVWGGWADDRTVRMTGDAIRLAKVIERRVYRQAGKGEECGALFATS